MLLLLLLLSLFLLPARGEKMKRAREMSGAKSRRFPTKLLSYSVLSLSLARGKMASSGRPRAYLDVAVGSAPPARLVVELRPDVAPRTCANFLALCSGERRKNASSSSRDPLWFQGTTFHLIIPG